MTTEDILEKFPPTKDHMLNILHEIQDNNPENFIEAEDIRKVAKHLNTTLSSVYGVIEYYSMLTTKPRGKYIIRLCKSPVCRMIGSFDALASLKKHLNIDLGETTKDGLFSLEPSECLGQCDKAPVLMVNEKVYTEMDDYKISNLLRSLGNIEHKNN